MKAALHGIAFTLTLLASCKSSEPVAGQVQDKVEVTALVTAVDLPKRELTLKGKDGVATIVEVSESVHNLDAVKVGDEVAVSYTEQVAWKVRPAGEASPGMASGAEVTRAEAGAKPGGTVGRSVTVTATITGIDKALKTVTLMGPGGDKFTLTPRDPKNLERVKIGDLLDITYSLQLAIAVREVKPAK